MPDLSGTVVRFTVRPGATTDTFPVILQEEARGGWHSYATLEERDALPMERRRVGMVAWVEEEGLAYRWTALATWTPLEFGGGEPGPPGPSAYEVAVANGFVGTEAAWLASLVGPAGVDGEDGEDGAAGADGASAYEVAVANGFVGTEADWLASLVGPAGADGEDGAAGADGADGASAYEVAVANGFVGTEAAWLASLVGPAGADGADGAAGAAGADGADGASAYEVAVANGFVGTEAAWLASLAGAAGADGADGADGASAYEVAVANGFVGTEAAWLASLVGPAGEDGADGATGPGVPAGGATGQSLRKASATDFHLEWYTPAAGGGGGEWLGAVSVAAPVYFSTSGPSWTDKTMHIYTGSTKDQSHTLPALSGVSDGYTIGIMHPHVAGGVFQLLRLVGASGDTFGAFGEVLYLFPGETIVLRKISFLGASLWQFVMASSMQGVWQHAAITWQASTTNPTKGSTRPADLFKWRRNGWGIDVKIWYEQTNAGTAGSGNYRFIIPTGSSYFDTTNPGISTNARGEGRAEIRVSTNVLYATPYVQSASSGVVQFRKDTTADWASGDTSYNFAQAGLSVRADMHLPFKRNQ